jgi:cytochrome b involved in lipid metabolism
MADVAQHASAASCYSVIRGEVYDLTSWIGKHPGGEEEILQLCGKDGTDKFVGKHGGSAPQEMKLESFVIGKLAE